MASSSAATRRSIRPSVRGETTSSRKPRKAKRSRPDTYHQLAPARSASDRRRHLLQADQAGKRAHFALLVLAQLKKKWHRGRFQLLHFLGFGIDDRWARTARI